MKKLTIRPFIRNDEIYIEKMIRKVFDEFISPDFSQKGRESFYDYISTQHIINRIEKSNHQLYLGFLEDKLVGIIEVRDKTHISLLFVDKDYHRQGIATSLFHKAFQTSLYEELSVNSSPYAAPIYEKLGFKKISGELIKDGITYIPMIKSNIK